MRVARRVFAGLLLLLTPGAAAAAVLTPNLVDGVIAVALPGVAYGAWPKRLPDPVRRPPIPIDTADRILAESIERCERRGYVLESIRPWHATMVKGDFQVTLTVDRYGDSPAETRPSFDRSTTSMRERGDCEHRSY